jgi:hypothetical protein
MNLFLATVLAIATKAQFACPAGWTAFQLLHSKLLICQLPEQDLMQGEDQDCTYLTLGEDTRSMTNVCVPDLEGRHVFNE